MAENDQGRDRDVSLVERIGNLFTDLRGTGKVDAVPECGVGNLCCHTDGAPRISVIGCNDEVTRSFHESALEASDRCTTPLLVDLSYNLDAEVVSGLTPPILLIKGKAVSDGVSLSVDEIGVLLEKEGFIERWEL